MTHSHHEPRISSSYGGAEIGQVMTKEYDAPAGLGTPHGTGAF